MRALLTAERSALNTVQHPHRHRDADAYLCRQALQVRAPSCSTRRPFPPACWRKHATRMGGATNHRMGLEDAAMIRTIISQWQDRLAGSAPRGRCGRGANHCRGGPDRPDQTGLKCGATHLLLDNMAVSTLRGAVTLVGGRVPTEASGGVRLERSGDRRDGRYLYPSVGRLTQGAPAADGGLDFATA